MADAIGIGLLGAGWITRAHGHALHTLNPVTPLARPIRLRVWWPPGHTVGWEHSLIHEWRDFLTSIIADRPLPPEQASFEDGYQAALLCDAIVASAAEGRRVGVDELTSTPATV